jgi:hypothetical protein
MPKKKMDAGIQILRLACIIVGLPVVLIILGLIVIFIRQATR